MKKFATILVLLGLGAFTVGCSQEAQLENAQEDLSEERIETQESMNEAVQDGVVTGDEQEEVMEERAEDVEAAGEVAEQQGEVIEEQND